MTATANDLTTDAVGLITAAHQGDVLGYARIANRLWRTQCGPAMTRELVDLLLDILGEVLHDDDAVRSWLDDFTQEWQRLKDEDRRHV